MSTLKTVNVQVGQSATANQNFTLYQPSVPDGTVRLGVGNSGATTADAVTVTNAGNATVLGNLTVSGAGTSTFAGNLTVTGNITSNGAIGTERIVQGTAQSATGASAVSFTGIPSWAKKITLVLNNALPSITNPLVQLGSGSYTTSGYTSSTFLFNTPGTFYTNSVSAAGFTAPAYSVMIFTLLSASSNTWAVTGTCLYPTAYSGFITGSITLAGTLDRIQANAGWSAGNTFTNGTINIIYEG